MTSDTIEFECFCGEEFEEYEKHHIRNACEGLSFYKKFNGNSYCVLHYPNKDKKEDFIKVFKEKIERNNFNFEGAYFPDTFLFPRGEVKSKVNFSKSTFSSAAYFHDVIFQEEATFLDANFLIETRFTEVIFKKRAEFGSYFEGIVSFKNVEALDKLGFSGAIIDARLFIEKCFFRGETTFHVTKFKKVSHFDNTEFADVDFRTSTFFDDVSFSRTTFHKTQFTNTRFEKHSSFYKSIFKENVYFIDKCEFYLTVQFAGAEFERNADFTEAIFGNVEAECDCEKGGYFEHTYFQGFAIFENTSFEYANFKWAVFEKEVVFRPTMFNKNADFTDTTFKATANFKGASFLQKAIFQGTIFEEQLRFIGSNDNTVFQEDNALNLNEVRITSPEKITFHTVRLRPSWFIDVDSRKFIFTRVNWENSDGNQVTVKKELDNVKDIKDARQLFIITCRQLAQNAEENNNLEKASDFRQMAFETEWLEKKKKFWNWINRLPDESEKLKRRVGGSESKEDEAVAPTNSFAITQRFDFVHLLYRITSYYGESWRWALGILIVIWFVFAFIYTQFSFSVCPQDKTNNLQETSSVCERSLYVGEAMKYSFGAMFLQKSETRKPLENAETFVLIENVLAPLQAALLALAIRRKFMR